jgi:MbtH protein
LNDRTLFVVLINDEEQYSLWPAGKDTPAGWRVTGTRGTEEECMKWVDEVWTDMRPASLRAAMAAQPGHAP